jgi:hypothetical protein
MKYLKSIYEFKLNLPKKKWEIISSNPTKQIAGQNLIELVDTAYKITPLGSFVKTISDVVKSDWLVIDYTETDGIDACIFYRNPRETEKWVGKKIQGIGHDGTKESKKIIIQKLIDKLNEDGFWIEASDYLEYLLNNNDVPKIEDVENLQKLFPNSKIELSNRFYSSTYERTLESGKVVKESVFGKPQFK